MVKTENNQGYVTQIIGPVLDIEFPSGTLPAIYSAIEIETADGIGNIVEVQQLLGDNKVRAVSMRSADLNRNAAMPWARQRRQYCWPKSSDNRFCHAHRLAVWPQYRVATASLRPLQAPHQNHRLSD